MDCDHASFETRTTVHTLLASDGVTSSYQLTVEGRCAGCQTPLLFPGLPVKPANQEGVFLMVACSANTQQVYLNTTMAAPVVQAEAVPWQPVL